MQQMKISFGKEEADILAEHSAFGFKDKSSFVRAALNHFRRELEKREMKKSAEIYAQLYQADTEICELTESALDGWPE